MGINIKVFILGWILRKYLKLLISSTDVFVTCTVICIGGESSVVSYFIRILVVLQFCTFYCSFFFYIASYKAVCFTRQ